MTMKDTRSILKTDNTMGNTPLHYSCKFLTLTDSLVVICSFLISVCPESVQATPARGYLPIHSLLRREFLTRPVLKAIELLLQEYPQSFEAVGSSLGGTVMQRSYNSVARRINSHLEEERGLNRSIHHVREASSNFEQSVSFSKDPLLWATSEAFGSWAASRVQLFKDRINDITEELEAVTIRDLGGFITILLWG